MRIARQFLLLLPPVILLACSSPNEPPLPIGPASFDKFPGTGTTVQAEGIIDLSAVIDASDADFAVTAWKNLDGTVTGNFRQRRSRAGLIVDFQGHVTCFTIDPVLHRVRIGGVITRNVSTDPAFLTTNHEIGDDVWFRMEQGPAGSIGSSTTYGFKPTLVNTSAEYCALPFTGLPAWNPATTFPVKSGMMRIRP